MDFYIKKEEVVKSLNATLGVVEKKTDVINIGQCFV
jgi:hypothetical protein